MPLALPFQLFRVNKKHIQQQKRNTEKKTMTNRSERAHESSVLNPT